MNTMKARYAVALVLLAAGCSGDKVDIGDPEVAITGEALADYAATWEGYAEAHRFPDGSDRIRLTLDANGAGTLVVGDTPPPAPPTDPDAVYLPNAPSTLLPGFAYPLHDAALRGARLQVSAIHGDVMQPWCAMQTPYEDPVNENGTYYCAPLWGMVATFDDQGVRTCWLTDAFGNRQGQWDCDMYRACSISVCVCDAESCDAPIGASYDLDAALEDEGQALVGTLLTGEAGRVTVRLERVD